MEMRSESNVHSTEASKLLRLIDKVVSEMRKTASALSFSLYYYFKT